MTTVCLVVFCGVPAAGKTTFAKAFADFLQLNEDSSANLATAPAAKPDYWVSHLIYDDMLPVVNSSQTSQVQSMQWKLHRRTINRCLDQLLSRLLSTASSCDANNDDPDPTGVPKVFDELTKHLDTCRPVILMLDDNMYYASMRYEIFQLARKYSTGYAQLYFPTKLEQAIDRNVLRGSPVPDDVIVSMAARIDIPTVENSWERRTVEWTEEDQCSHNFHKVLEMIKEAFGNPVQPSVDDLSIHESRVICSTNLIHRCDCILRQLVTENISIMKAKLSDSHKLQSHAKRLNEARHAILNDMRQRRILAPLSVVDSTVTGSNSRLCEFVTNAFEEYVTKGC